MMTRTEAIKHFSYPKYNGMTIKRALISAPAAVRHGLAARDLEWIERFPNVLPHQAIPRLHARSIDNPDGEMRHTITVHDARGQDGLYYVECLQLYFGEHSPWHRSRAHAENVAEILNASGNWCGDPPDYRVVDEHIEIPWSYID